MTDQSKAAELEWRDGKTPVATRFDDPYYSLQNGAAESRHVFLEGNDLAARLRPGFTVAELGFGTGLNLAVLLDFWRAMGASGQIQFISFEAYPLNRADAAQALQHFAAAYPAIETVLDGFTEDGFQLERPEISARVVIGDARETVAHWIGQADAWFLDGFSPAKNPELWEANLMQNVYAKTAAGGSFATYTAAGHVRAKLSDAGFHVTRVPGFGRKRHMTIGHKDG